jgi:hypothetical protein
MPICIIVEAGRRGEGLPNLIHSTLVSFGSSLSCCMNTVVDHVGEQKLQREPRRTQMKKSSSWNRKGGSVTRMIPFQRLTVFPKIGALPIGSIQQQRRCDGDRAMITLEECRRSQNGKSADSWTLLWRLRLGRTYIFSAHDPDSVELFPAFIFY